jgi:phosphate-selective porin OprO/OprP
MITKIQALKKYFCAIAYWGQPFSEQFIIYMITTGKTFLSVFLFLLMALTVTAQDTSFVFKPTIKVAGRIHYDFELLKLGEESTLKNGFRRVRFAMSGNVGTRLRYMIDVDFARARLGFRHMYIQYRTDKLGDFGVGSMPEPTSLNMLTPSHYITFFERAMLTSLQNFRFGAGFHYQHFGLLEQRMGIQLAYTFNGVNTEGFYDDDLAGGGNFTARISGKPYEDKNTRSLFHLGVNFAHRTNDEALDYQLVSRTENATGDKVVAFFDHSGKVFSRRSLGFEAAGVLGALSIQGEYKRCQIITDEMIYRASSYYGFISYFLTGEYRTYKNGAFSKVTPRRSVDKNGFGAIELALRYSVMNTSDVPTKFMEMPVSGLTQDIALGLNWYLNANARIMYNFIVTDFGFYAPNPDFKELAHLMRFQVHF